MFIKCQFCIETFCVHCGIEVMLIVPLDVEWDSDYLPCPHCDKNGLLVLQDLLTKEIKHEN